MMAIPGVAAFETANSQHAGAKLEAIKSVTDKPVKYALHTHNHWDHSRDGKVMQDVGAQTVMHMQAAEWLAANPGRDSSHRRRGWLGNSAPLVRSTGGMGRLCHDLHSHYYRRTRRGFSTREKFLYLRDGAAIT